jgi:hypothetical protein
MHKINSLAKRNKAVYSLIMMVMPMMMVPAMMVRLLGHSAADGTNGNCNYQ